MKVKKYLVGIDYYASYKPMTIDYRLIEADDLFTALDYASDLFFNFDTNDDFRKVYLIEVFEQTRSGSNRYVSRMISREPYAWHTALYDRKREDKVIFREGDVSPVYLDD